MQEFRHPLQSFPWQNTSAFSKNSFNPLWRQFFLARRNCLTLKKMDSTEDRMAEMSREFKSRSKAKVIVESGLYALIVLFLFVGNFLTLLVMLLNRRMRTIANMFVASLAVSDLLLGVFLAASLGIPTLVTSRWPFSDTTCQFQGYLAFSLAFASIHTLVLMAVNRCYKTDECEPFQTCS